MMKKAIKKLLAALLAVAMVCAMAIPAFAYNPGETEEDLNTKHEYAAFQIFTGDVKGNNIDDFKISNAKWGESITNPTEFLAQLTADSTIGGEFKTNFTPQEAVAVISKWGDSDDTASLLRVVYATISTRMETRNPSFKVFTPVASKFQSQVII